MLAILFCLGGIAALLLVAEVLSRKKITKNEGERKFLHISGGIFIAFWPWLISWQAIAIIGLAMLAVIIGIRLTKGKIHFLNGRKRISYGDICFPMAVVVCSLLTDQKVFFALAILHMAIADGFAAVVGKRYGRTNEYKVFHQVKTLCGSITFWMLSLFLLGGGVLFAYGSIGFSSYLGLLVFLPPVLTVVENVIPYGFDNLAIPLAVMAGLSLAQLS